MILKNLWGIWTWMRQIFFFLILNIRILLFQKKSVFQIHQLWTFFHISGKGPWVSRRYPCKGQGCSSTYMVVRLSNKRAKTTKNAFLPLKWPFVGQPDNLMGWATPLTYTWVSSTYPRTYSWNFGEKMFKIGRFEKLTFFETTKFQ